jgi:PPOX class probable FMN-dependent enzyme
MSEIPFRDVLTSEDELRAIVGRPSELAVRKEIAYLDAHCRAFIARSPFVLIATAGASGRVDVSPKGDPPGFVQVLDDHRLVIPDRPGNRRLDGMRNLLENPHVGLLFLIPGLDETLRVNGRAWIIRDEEVLARCTVMGKRPTLALGVYAEECFIHCAKAFKRAQLWQPTRWPDRSGLASPAEMLLDHARPQDMTLSQVERRLQESYEKNLY